MDIRIDRLALRQDLIDIVLLGLLISKTKWTIVLSVLSGLLVSNIHTYCEV